MGRDDSCGNGRVASMQRSGIEALAHRVRDFTLFHRGYDLARARVRTTVGGISLRARLRLARELTQHV